MRPRRSALFYGTMLCEVFRGLADKSRGRGITDGLDPDVFGTAPEMIAVSFDAASFVQRKFLALAAHRSAFGVTEEMVSSPPSGAREMLDAFRPVFEREVFEHGAEIVEASRGTVSAISSVMPMPTGWGCERQELPLHDDTASNDTAIIPGASEHVGVQAVRDAAPRLHGHGTPRTAWCRGRPLQPQCLRSKS